VPQDISDFEETYDFDLEFCILDDGDGGRPPYPFESPPYTPRNESEEDSEEEEEHKIEPKNNLIQIILYQPPNMAGDNANQNPPLYQPWLVPDAVSIQGIVHDMPKHTENFLPKFDPDRKDSVEEHVKKFLLSIRLQIIRHKDVVCRLFPLTFENRASTWLFSLEEASITD
jgi:hypothetical protein